MQEPPEVAEWIRRHGKPVTGDHGINRDGLEEAATDMARSVQRRLYLFHDAGEPLDVVVDLCLVRARFAALTALDHLGNLGELGGQRFAKTVEAGVAPNGQPLAVCVGSQKREQVPLYFRGRPEEWLMAGYLGCLRTFPDAPFGPGRRWPRFCPDCGQRRTNDRSKKRTGVRRRAAEITDAINSRT